MLSDYEGLSSLVQTHIHNGGVCPTQICLESLLPAQGWNHYQACLQILARLTLGNWRSFSGTDLLQIKIFSWTKIRARTLVRMKQKLESGNQTFQELQEKRFNDLDEKNTCWSSVQEFNDKTGPHQTCKFWRNIAPRIEIIEESELIAI